MLHEDVLTDTMLDILNNRISSIAGTIEALVNEGYIPNKKKSMVLQWSIILIDAYENFNLFSEEQQNALDNIYNKVLKL